MATLLKDSPTFSVFKETSTPGTQHPGSLFLCSGEYSTLPQKDVQIQGDHENRQRDKNTNTK